MKLNYHNLVVFLIFTIATAHRVKSPAKHVSDEESLVHFHEEDLKEIFHDNGVLNLDKLNKNLDQCEVVRYLNVARGLENEMKVESYIEWVFERLFPFGPAANALLATAYISGPPNFILALIPSTIQPSSLSYLVSFAIGGLLGDVFLHLLPQTFLGEPLDDNAQFVLVDEKRNAVLGVFIFIGFLVFLVIDKGLRILEHGDSSENSFSHSHSHSHQTTTVDKKEEKESSKAVIDKPNASIKTSAYLNLISDFAHNITDGLAIASSFYISKSVGSTTCLAVFFHEIPHEIGDFALLIQGGFSKWQAMNSQFITAAGAFLGAFIGIGIQQLTTKQVSVVGSSLAEHTSSYGGLFGTTVEIGDLTLPFTAGGFLYIATVGVIPEILELGDSSTRFQEVKKSIGQLFCIFVGITIMFLISWFE